MLLTIYSYVIPVVLFIHTKTFTVNIPNIFYLASINKLKQFCKHFSSHEGTLKVL